MAQGLSRIGVCARKDARSEDKEAARNTMGRGIWRNRDGAALVEFAVVLPVLVLLLVGLMEFGLLLYDQHVITNASREGARYGIVSRASRRNLTEITAVVDEYCGSRLISFGADAPVTSIEPTDPSGALFGDDLTVTVTFHYDFLVVPAFVGSLIGGTDLHAQTTMKYE